MVRWRGTLFIMQLDTEQKKRSSNEDTERQPT